MRSTRSILQSTRAKRLFRQASLSQKISVGNIYRSFDRQFDCCFELVISIGNGNELGVRYLTRKRRSKLGTVKFLCSI